MAGADKLCLRAALLAWCQPGLAQTMIEAGATFRRDWRSGHPDPFPDEEDISYAGYERVRARDTTYDRFAQARRNLVDDFKRRLEVGDLVLTGLSMLPFPATSLMTIPKIWLKGLEFGWTTDTLRFGPNVLIAKVTVQRRAGSRLATGKSKGGRAPFPRAHMVEIARSLPRCTSNKETARALLAEFSNRYRGESPPEFRTVYDHVVEIYAEAASSASSPIP